MGSTIRQEEEGVVGREGGAEQEVEERKGGEANVEMEGGSGGLVTPPATTPILREFFLM